jgi:hypothetical protein
MRVTFAIALCGLALTLYGAHIESLPVIMAGVVLAVVTGE